jgi:hypothetical protein
MNRLAVSLAVCATVAGIGVASAQIKPNLQGRPAFGAVALVAGFEPDPHEVQIQAGGPHPAQALGGDCAGFIDYRQPDLNLDYRAGPYPLFISAKANADLTLVINLPDGSWQCSDDFEGLNPGVVIQRPASGTYNIWVGTFERGGLVPSLLQISEIPPRSGN